MKTSHIVLLGMLLLGSVILISGCNAKPGAEKGSVVQVEYTGKLTDGTVFDSSVGKQPLEFTAGAGQMIPGFDNAVLGMKVGESKTVTIPAADAYGPSRADLITVIPRTQLPPDLTPEVGQQLQAIRQDGSTATYPITAVTNTTVTLDTNHPLAGKDLVFEIKLISIK